MSSTSPRTILLAGASRGLGLGLAREFLRRGWHVIATARTPDSAGSLQDLHRTHADLLTIAPLDIANSASIAALSGALGRRPIDVVFVVAGMSTQRDTALQDMAPDAIALEFITNATAPIVLAETLLPNLPETGTVAFMTSILGSIASNAGGGMDVYRASKAALNMLGANFAIRHKNRPVLLLHPGWVRTHMGGSSAPVDVETSARGLADQIEYAKKPGIGYLDYQGQKLPW
jgi:NAD(P)-dependent dehydrogenase (short-subunit alcohol dehydrogenase family)